MSAQFRLNEHLIEWNRFLNEEWRPALDEEANAKADYEHKFNLLKASFRVNQPTIAATWAETMVNANDEVYTLNLKRRLAEAKVESLRKVLNYMEARADAIRSEVSSERQESKLHSANQYTA